MGKQNVLSDVLQVVSYGEKKTEKRNKKKF